MSTSVAGCGKVGGAGSPEPVEALLSMDGVIAVEPVGREVLDRVVEIETSIKCVSGGMRIDNRGILDFKDMDRVYVMFCDRTFPRPDQVTMEMVDDAGNVVGHDVPPCMVQRFRSRDDVIWMGDGFVLYPGLVGNGDVTMVMLSSGLSIRTGEGEVDARMFYPSVESAELLGTMFGHLDSKVAAVIVGVSPGQFL